MGNKGKLAGEWYRLTDRFQKGDSKDVITFIEADNPYFKGDLVFSRNNNVQGKEAYSGPNGLFEVDYSKKRFIVKNRVSGGSGKILPADTENGSYVISYYGIFDIDESGPRAKLKVSYQKDSYPDTFDDALEYVERGK